jgi:hypothetical protein
MSLNFYKTIKCHMSKMQQKLVNFTKYSIMSQLCEYLRMNVAAGRLKCEISLKPPDVSVRKIHALNG